MKTQNYFMSGIRVLGKARVKEGKEEEECVELILCAKQFIHTHTHTHTVSIHKPLRGQDLGPHFTLRAAEALRSEVPSPLVKEHMGSSPGVRTQLCLTSRPWKFRAKCPPLLSRDGGLHFPPALGSGPPW